MRNRARGGRVVLGAVGVAMTFAVAGCGAPPWAQGGNAAPASPSPTQVSSPAPQPVPNDLSSGSTQKTVTAGAVSATVNYWSTLSMDKWTPTALKPVSLSMVTTVTPDDGQKVYLQRATMTAVPGNETQSFAPLAAQTDQSNAPGYLVLAPYSYSQTFNVGEVPADATFVTLQFTYEYLVQATPTSDEYAKQTASDTLTVAIAGGGSAG
ncbi:MULTISPECIES: hypothetical protein [Microbacterium]|jgi:hypothetical protein|uniref:hypothetical protein n=1 Tax=Microbacterium TaxID=33882 RepID=UPI0007947F40|nr:hypothetical protein [Microbacterium testaceum]KTS05061.1 hypothetical protein NS283_07385 [Microbacterium testaceum]KTS92221.1 hypothetical protein NS183_00655 [Microbacterium testaceum]